MAAPQTGLTSCQIGDIGHPRTVQGNTRYIAIHHMSLPLQAVLPTTIQTVSPDLLTACKNLAQPPLIRYCIFTHYLNSVKSMIITAPNAKPILRLLQCLLTLRLIQSPFLIVCFADICTNCSSIHFMLIFNA